MVLNLSVDDCLPDDIDDAILLGRAWVPGQIAGPSPIVVREGRIFDCLLYTSPSPRDLSTSRMPSSA